jgi:miniconductance mechanosensitive channel
MLETIQSLFDVDPVLMPWVLGGIVLILSVVVFLIARYFIARGLVYLSERTETKYDDILVEKLRPFRFAWIAPLLLIYYFAYLVPEGTEFVRQIALFLILWLVVITASSLLNAVNAIYESSHFYRGESIQGYLDLVKVALIVVAILLSVSLLTGKSVLVLLSGLGVIMALLVLIFRDTILSFVASVQISSSDLVMEGDSIEMPSYGADGEVKNIALHVVTVQNWDKTITVIPTYKLLDTPYKNWRGMEESGGRRIKRSVHIDLNSIKFCDQEMLERLGKVALLEETVQAHLAKVEETSPARSDDPLGGPQLTNMDLFQSYTYEYLRKRPDLHQEGMTLLVRQLAPGTTGMPLEVYAFTNSVEWAEYEATQSEIFDHLVAAMPYFDLWVYQRSGTGHPES